MILTLVLATLILTATAYAASPAERIARTITATWTCQDAIRRKRTPAGNIWAKHSIGYRQWQLKVWQARLETCRQQNWKAWLPRNWYLVGSCESGYGRDPNWAHGNSSYVSAFGIQRGSFRGAYDHDAARVGMPPWSDDPAKRPSPWAQYQTALSHYKAFGDGWGCPGP